jgi:prepilin-type N-terminal cleavage/methylation domain-containing protein
MKTLHKHTKAFTMLELVFVIVVLGILASLALPRMDRDLRQEAKDNILSAIRYTQHLALNDDKTDPSDTLWQKKLWKISFSTSGNNLANFYTISSDADQDGFVDKDESAIDPVNGKYMYNLGGNTVIEPDESPNIFIGKTYGVNSITFSDACNDAQHIAFDHLGRPHNDIGDAENDYDEYMDSDCTIQFGFVDTSIKPLKITIATETGHVSAD